MPSAILAEFTEQFAGLSNEAPDHTCRPLAKGGSSRVRITTRASFGSGNMTLQKAALTSNGATGPDARALENRARQPSATTWMASKPRARNGYIDDKEVCDDDIGNAHQR